jgi:beta-glucosidase
VDQPNDPPLNIGNYRLPDAEYTAMDWMVYPQGLTDLLQRVARDYPVQALYITENGAAYNDEPPQIVDGTRRVRDRERTLYYAQHLAAAQQAMVAGVPLKGYFAWSLMDNFEWAFGYTKRFGITYVDYATQERTIKDSGLWYADLIRRSRATRSAGNA